MKKLFSLFLAAMMVLSLCACQSSKTPQSPEPNHSNTGSTIPEEELPKPAESVQPPSSDTHNPEDQPPVPEDIVYVASEDDMLCYVIEHSRSEERNEALDIFTGEEAVEWMNMYGLSADFVEACAVSYPMINVSAYTAAILKPTSNGEDPALEMLNTYKESRMLSFKHYLEEQYDIAAAARIFTEGPYVCLVMADDADAEEQSIRSLLSQADTLFAIDPEKISIPQKEMDISQVLEINEAFRASTVADIEYSFEWFSEFKHEVVEANQFRFDVDPEFYLQLSILEGDIIGDILLVFKANSALSCNLRYEDAAAFIDSMP